MIITSKIKTGSTTKKLILIVLELILNKESECSLSIETLTEYCELPSSVIYENIESLVEDGFIEIIKQTMDNDSLLNTYRLKLEGVENYEFVL